MRPNCSEPARGRSRSQAASLDKRHFAVGRIRGAGCEHPHKTREVASQAVAEATIRAYDEVWCTRSNDPQIGAEVVTMQGPGERAISGHILDDNDVECLCLLIEYRLEYRFRAGDG